MIQDVAARNAGSIDRQGCVELYSNWKHWICLFPQHGPGPKHLRRIQLAAWQLDLVARYPGEFLAGLIHSDGCRVTNRVMEYQYARYMFANESADIRSMFEMACGFVGVDCSRAGRRNISVARRAGVDVLDRLGCRKA